jgi:hypothetical protein
MIGALVQQLNATLKPILRATIAAFCPASTLIVVPGPSTSLHAPSCRLSPSAAGDPPESLYVRCWHYPEVPECPPNVRDRG